MQLHAILLRLTLVAKRVATVSPADAHALARTVQRIVTGLRMRRGDGVHVDLRVYGRPIALRIEDFVVTAYKDDVVYHKVRPRWEQPKNGKKPYTVLLTFRKDAAMRHAMAAIRRAFAGMFEVVR